MKWVTYGHLHLDRVATPWLILRFVDPDAEFTFIDRGKEADAPGGAIGFGIPGSAFGPHDADGTAFRKVMRGYHVRDPAVDLVERIVAAGVRHALALEPPEDQTEEESVLGAALDRLGQGLAIAFDDADHLAAALPLYDALYANCRVRLLPGEVVSEMPAGMIERVDFLRRRIRPSSR
ncbi:MAG TPA: chromate resistance protein ChrB domain-containing protein [Gaiellaceae bacterium]|jgi:hypothetical protein|nr:chromate resistance protein ChrB domain-containing protein [Acidimicrobiia bacterium]HKG11387.1 chromate resistance protein ChrB domain-containing protein [Gaiellaceae bacterium]